MNQATYNAMLADLARIRMEWDASYDAIMADTRAHLMQGNGLLFPANRL